MSEDAVDVAEAFGWRDCPSGFLARNWSSCLCGGWRTWLVVGSGASRVLRLPAAVCEGEAWRVVPFNVVGRDQSASSSASTEDGAFGVAPVSRAFRIAVAGCRGSLRSSPLGAYYRCCGGLGGRAASHAFRCALRERSRFRWRSPDRRRGVRRSCSGVLGRR